MIMLTFRMIFEFVIFLVKMPFRLFWVAQEWRANSYAVAAYQEYLTAYGNPLPDAQTLKTAHALGAAVAAHEKFNQVVSPPPTRGYFGNLGAGLKLMSLLFLFSACGSMFTKYARPTLTREVWRPFAARHEIPAQWIAWTCWNFAHAVNEMAKSRAYADRVSPAPARPDMAYLTPAGLLISVQTQREIQYRPGLHILDSCGGEWPHEELSTALKAKVVRSR